MSQLELVLASQSPRRSEIFEGLGLRFSVLPADIDEDRLSGELPEDYVNRVAREKAAAQARSDRLVVSGDTIVVLDGEVLVKPRDPADARHMLGKLAGRSHRVLTALAVAAAPEGVAQTLSQTDSSTVQLAAMSPTEIDWYVDTGEPLDKAGSYAIQGLGALFVEAIEGNYSNVVGMPVPTLYRLVRKLGFSLLDFRRPD